jgi:hypothetical protein
MKSIAIILLIAFFIAIFTVPSHEKFNKYLDKDGKNIGACLGGTRHESFKVFSLDYVDYCGPVNFNPGIATNRKIKTDKYLGLFGRFWKL